MTSRCSSLPANTFLYEAFYCWLSAAGNRPKFYQKRRYHSSVPSVSQADSLSLPKDIQGTRLVDYIRTGELSIQASQGTLRMPENSFDVYNSNASLLRPRRHHRRKQQLTASSSPVIIDNLETATILALRMQHVKHGHISLEEITQFAQTLFATSRKSAIAEILALEPGSNDQKEDIPSDEVQKLINQPIINESQRMARVLRALDRHGFTKHDLSKWITCITAPQLHTALGVMDSDLDVTPRRWPKFLVLFTLRRYCNSRLAAYSLTRWFSVLFPLYTETDPVTQTKMLLRVLQGVQQWVPDLVPTICQIAFHAAHPGLCTAEVMNQVLWVLSRFGQAAASMDPRETSYAMRAQSIVVDQMTRQGIPLDTKGYLAIGYTLRKESPERARAFLGAIRRHDYPYSDAEMEALNGGEKRPYHGTFPYIQGPTCLEILLSVSGDQALTAFDSIQSPNGMQWAILLRQLREVNELTPETTQTLWDKIKASDVISPHLLSQVIMGFGSLEHAQKIIQEYPEYMTSSLASTYLKLACRAVGGRGLNNARQLLSNMEYKPLAGYNALLAGELYQGDPRKMWSIYDDGIMGPSNNYEPDKWTLYYLCKAGWNPGLVWDGLYAAQRMVVEFKHWVRGAYVDGGDSADYLKVYPSSQLFYAYIVMLGRAGYQDDLLEVLPWMQRISFEPSKLCLCALITYAPNGRYLMKHAQVEGVGGEWPTEYELRQYQSSEAKRDDPRM